MLCLWNNNKVGIEREVNLDRAHIFQDGYFTEGERGLFIARLRHLSNLKGGTVGTRGSLETCFLWVLVLGNCARDEVLIRDEVLGGCVGFN